MDPFKKSENSRGLVFLNFLAFNGSVVLFPSLILPLVTVEWENNITKLKFVHSFSIISFLVLYYTVDFFQFV